MRSPLPADVSKELAAAIAAKDAKKIQEVLDKHVLFVVSLNPEARVKVARGPADAKLQQAGDGGPLGCRLGFSVHGQAQIAHR